MTSLPQTTDTKKGFIKTVDSPRVPAMDYRSGFKDVAGAIDNTNKFLGEYTKMKYEGFQADLDRLELQHLHEMVDAKDPCELEAINERWNKEYDNALKDDFWAKSYYKSNYYNRWKDRNQEAQQKLYYRKQHEFAEICANSTLNKLSETAAMLDTPEDIAQYLRNGEAMLANTEHLTAENKYKLMTNFYKDTVSKLYNSDPNKAVAWLDYAGESYDQYGLDKEEVRTKAEAYNRARKREAEQDYKRSLALQKQANDIELGKLAAKIATGEAGVEDIKQASDAGLFTTNPFKEAEMYKALNKKEKRESETPNFQSVRQLVRTNQFDNISDLVDNGIDNGLKDSEIKSLVTLWKDKNPTEKKKESTERVDALNNYKEGLETAEDNESLYLSGERSKAVYDEIKKLYSEKEKAALEEKKKEIEKAAYDGTLTNEYLDEAVESGSLPADVALKYKKALINDDEAVDKQISDIDEAFSAGTLTMNDLRKKVATKEYSRAAFNYGSNLIKEQEQAKKAEEQARKAKEAAAEKARAAEEKRSAADSKAMQKNIDKELKALEKERKEREELEDYKFITSMIDRGQISKDSQISVLETGGKPVNENAAKRAKKYLSEVNKEKEERKKKLKQAKAEVERNQKRQNFIDDYALAKTGNLGIEDIKQNQIEGRYATQDDVNKLESAYNGWKKKQEETATEKKNRQALNLQNFRDEGQQLALIKSTTSQDYNNYITKVTNAAANEDILPTKASELINEIAIPRLEAHEKDLEQYGTDYLMPWKADEGYFALKSFIQEVLGSEKRRPKEGKSSADERKAWDKMHAQRAAVINNIYDLYRASLENIAKENQLNSVNDILTLDDEKRALIYNGAVENTKTAYAKSLYPNYQNDGQGTAIISGGDLVRIGTPQNTTDGLKDNRFTSLIKSPSTGRYGVVLSDGTRKEITEEEYKRLGGK